MICRCLFLGDLDGGKAISDQQVLGVKFPVGGPPQVPITKNDSRKYRVNSESTLWATVGTHSQKRCLIVDWPITATTLHFVNDISTYSHEDCMRFRHSMGKCMLHGIAKAFDVTLLAVSWVIVNEVILRVTSVETQIQPFLLRFRVKFANSNSPPLHNPAWYIMSINPATKHPNHPFISNGVLFDLNSINKKMNAWCTRCLFLCAFAVGKELA